MAHIGVASIDSKGTMSPTAPAEAPTDEQVAVAFFQGTRSDSAAAGQAFFAALPLARLLKLGVTEEQILRSTTPSGVLDRYSSYFGPLRDEINVRISDREQRRLKAASRRVNAALCAA